VSCTRCSFTFSTMGHLSRKSEPFSEQKLKFFLELLLSEWVAGEKKICFFVKVRPRRLCYKKSDVRTCLRSRPKCSQSVQTLKKRSSFVYHTQRKHGKLRQTSSYRKLTPDPPSKQKCLFWEEGHFFDLFLQFLFFYYNIYEAYFIGLNTYPGRFSGQSAISRHF